MISVLLQEWLIRIAVMYAGQIIEKGRKERYFL